MVGMVPRAIRCADLSAGGRHVGDQVPVFPIDATRDGVKTAADPDAIHHLDGLVTVAGAGVLNGALETCLSMRSGMQCPAPRSSSDLSRSCDSLASLSLALLVRSGIQACYWLFRTRGRYTLEATMVTTVSADWWLMRLVAVTTAVISPPVQYACVTSDPVAYE